jgi:hypothetical protein
MAVLMGRTGMVLRRTRVITPRTTVITRPTAVVSSDTRAITLEDDGAPAAQSRGPGSHEGDHPEIQPRSFVSGPSF